MDSGTPIEVREPPREDFTTRFDRQRVTADQAVVWLHSQVDRLDLAPPDFGAEQPVDTTDASAIRREWLRLLRRWMDNNPEEMLAIKAGGVALGLVLIVLVAFVRSMS